MIIVVVGIVAMTVGDVSGRFAVRARVDAVARPAGLTGGTRLRNLLIASSRLVTGRTLVDLTINRRGFDPHRRYDPRWIVLSFL